MSNILNFIVWLPIIGALAVLFTPQKDGKTIRVITLITTAVTFALTILLYWGFDQSLGGIQPHTMVKAEWIKSFNIFYSLGIDGISLPMIILNGLLFLICTLSSWKIEKSIKGYFALLLILESAIFGVFMSLDFFLFYLYWEAMLIPMFFLIGIWGGENREYAAIKFFIYTFFGSILMLIGIIGLYYVSGQNVDSFNIIALQGGKFSDVTFNLLGKTFSFESVMYWVMFLGFAIKVPVFPFHTWLPHAHVQAPTAVSVILAGVLLKMGAYGFLRISFPIFPKAAVASASIIALLGVISIVYGAFCAMAQKDMKKVIAYSSVSHMGYVMLGLAAMTPEGMNGAVLQMFNHGTSTAMMFLMIGVLYDRSHHRWIVKPDGSLGYGGLALSMPIYTSIFVIGLFASLGLPGLSGFVSEMLIFLGSFEKFTLYTCISALGLLIGAGYLLWMFKRMFFGIPNADNDHAYPDMNCREIGFMIPLCVAVIWFGIHPAPVINMMKSSVGELVLLLAKF